MDNCCRNPNLRRAYIPCKPFKAKYCLNCGEVILEVNRFWTFIWTYFVSPFWNGAIKVLVSEEDADKYFNEQRRA